MRDAIRLSGDSPRRFKRSGADQSKDSPTGGRTACCGSMQTTFRPARANCSEPAFPAKPPPMTVTSQSIDGVCPGIMRRFYDELETLADLCEVKRLEYLLHLPEMAALMG